MGDTNSIIRAFLAGQTAITDIVDTRIYCPRLPENADLPALGFFTRGGTSTPYIPYLVEPSIEFDCWASAPIVARGLYMAIYDALQGIQNETVVVGLDTFHILSAIEEVQGQDLQDVDIPNYFRVLAFFKILINTKEV